MAADHHYRPADWLRQLAHLQSARWPWGLSLRGALCLAAPLAAGLATGRVETGLWVAMGTLAVGAGEGAGTYRSRFRQMAIAAPIGAAGYLAGYLMVLPYPAVIAAMAAVAFLAGIVSSYGAPYSIGMMQALLAATIAIALPQAAPFWQPALLYLLGAGLCALALTCEALIDRRRPERQMLADQLTALAGLATALASAHAATPPGGSHETAGVEAARRRAVDGSRALYRMLLEKRRSGRTHETVAHAAVLDAADSLFSALLAEQDPAALSAAAQRLRDMADEALHPSAPRSPATGDGPLMRQVADLATTIATGDRVFALAPEPDGAPQQRPRLSDLASRLIVGPAVLRSSAKLALCIAIAFAARYVLHASHWYWVPLTVAIVMKPDFGSVFVRAVLRAVGTTAGVVIGTAMLILLPKGYLMIAAIALLAAALPWAKLVSYGAQAMVLTPLVLVLLDVIQPTTQMVNYGMERLIATATGGAIVLVFGYFLWPRRHARELATGFAAAMAALADFLAAACAPQPAGPAPADGRLGDARRIAYARLSDLRAALAQSLGEPPPAGREAAAWFPIVAGAERICDRVSAHVSRRAAGTAQPAAAETAAVAAQLRHLVAGSGTPAALPAAPQDPFLQRIAQEAALIAQRLDDALPAGRAGA